MKWRGPTEGPDTRLFKRFRREWSSIDHAKYYAAPDSFFQNPVLSSLRQEMLEYLPQALEKQQPRDDYQELLYLSLLFLGSQHETKSIRAPGPTHHARWMGKGIYALKIFLFNKQFQMSPEDLKNVTDLALFVSLVYVKYWNEAPIAIRAPFNDIELLNVLETYPNKGIANAAVEALSRHLWYLSEHLVTLALFDERVTTETKEKMVQNFDRPHFPGSPRVYNLLTTGSL